MQLNLTELVMLIALIVFIVVAMLIFFQKRKSHRSDPLKADLHHQLEILKQQIPTRPDVELQPQVEILKQNIPTRIVIEDLCTVN